MVPTDETLVVSIPTYMYIYIYIYIYIAKKQHMHKHMFKAMVRVRIVQVVRARMHIIGEGMPSHSCRSIAYVHILVYMYIIQRYMCV